MTAPFTYLDVCSGIGAASVAWSNLGWRCAGYAEIEAFPRAVLDQRHGAVAVDWDHRHSPTLTKQSPTGGGQPQCVATAGNQAWAVRRLTPRECERLQAFPDDFTAIHWRGKDAPDGPRYKAIGNSMAVNVMRWIGTRIALVEQAIAAGEAQP